MSNLFYSQITIFVDVVLLTLHNICIRLVIGKEKVSIYTYLYLLVHESINLQI